MLKQFTVTTFCGWVLLSAVALAQTKVTYLSENLAFDDALAVRAHITRSYQKELSALNLKGNQGFLLVPNTDETTLAEKK